MGLFPGIRDEPPGASPAAERPPSVMVARDGEVLADLLSFYRRPPGPVVDVTANRRRIWQGVGSEGVLFCDADPDVEPAVVCDFRHLPFADDSVAVLVYDPPHLPSAAGSPASREQLVRDFGFARSADDVNDHHAAFLPEAARVLAPEGLVFAKICDFVHDHRYRWALVDFVNLVRGTEGLTPCDLRIKQDPRGGNIKSGRWRRAYHSRRCHSWYVVVRKGGCEPRGGA